MLQDQIDTGSQEGRREDQQYNLKLETQLIVRVVVHHDTANVATAFSSAAETDTDHVGPCFIADTEADLDEAAEAEEGGEEGVPAQRWVVAVDCAFDGTLETDCLAGVGDCDLGWGRHGWCVEEGGRRCEMFAVLEGGDGK